MADNLSAPGLRNEEALNNKNTQGESEKFYKAIFENMGSPIAIFDENNYFYIINSRFADLLGYTREELEGKRVWMDFVVADDRKRMLEYHNARMNAPANAPLMYEFGMIGHNGETRDMLIHIVVLPGTKKSVATLTDITDRKHAEQELNRSENLYRAIFENTGNASILVEEDTTISLANSEWVNLSGYSKEEQEGKMSWTQFVCPEDVERMVGYHKKRRQYPGSAPMKYEFRFINRFGDIHDMVVHVVMIPGTKRSVVSLLDITERKKAEKALQESERRLGDIIDFLPDSTFAIDMEGKVTAWNRAIELMTGASKQDMIGKGNYEYAIPFYGTRRPILIDLAFADDEEISRNYINVHRNGNLLVAETFAPAVYNGKGAYLWGIVTLFHDASGNVTGAIESIRDITEFTRVEKALRESENTYRAIFENTGSATTMLEEDTTISLANSQWVALSGYSKEEQEGKMSWTQFVHPEDVERMVEYHKKRRLDPGSAPMKYEFRFVTRYGVIHDMVVHVVMIPGTKKSIASLVDITERKRAEEEKLQIERKLLHSQKLESLGLLAGGIAHDFNNLLLAVLGNLDIVLMKLPHDEGVRRNIEQAMTAGRHATELTRQMLAYSGRGSFVITSVDVSRLVEENYHMLRVAVPRTITLKLELKYNLPVVMADAGQIQQVILNLITNASEAFGEEYGEIILATGCIECDEEYLLANRVDSRPMPGLYTWIEVRDTGCGMDEATQQKLFDPFFTTKFTGRGLGMSAVMGIVMAHSGAIVINSRQGEGTTIRVLFPTSIQDASERTDNEKMATEVYSQNDKKRTGTVLVVDDEKMVRDLTCELVEFFGYKTLAAEDGDEAVKIFSETDGKIDCVILDLTMPRLDGLATFNKLRLMKSDVKVILASGFSEQDATSRFSGEGLAGFIQKPYTLEKLRGELGKIIRED